MYKSNRKQVQKEMDRAKKTMLDAVGRAGASFVKADTPVAEVNGGSLRASIEHRVDKNSIFVGSTMTSEDYPIYVHQGTYKMAAQPYIHNGIMNHLIQLRKIAEGNFKL